MNKLCQRLKSLRLNRNLTQTEVAIALNVTTQAVSKWESQLSLPDISLLIPLADYYAVTVDYLLGHDIVEKEKEICDYLESCESNFAFRSSDEWNDIIEETRVMLRKHPTDHRLMVELCSELFMLYKRCAPDSKYLSELLEWGGTVIDQSTDTRIRYQATKWMIYAYHELGLYENAKKMADTMPDLTLSKEVLRYYCSKYGTRENLEGEQHLVYKCFDELCGSMLKYGTDVESRLYTNKEKLLICQNIASMIRAYHCNADFDGVTLEYLYRSELYAALYAAIGGDTEKVLTLLKSALGTFEKIDNISASVLQRPYTSPFLKELSAPLGCSKDYYQKLFIKVTCHSSFDTIREEDVFKNIEIKFLAE